MTPIPEQQRLFTRILRFTLLRGVVIGLLVAVTGMWISNFSQSFFGDVFFEGPLGSLSPILCGALMVLQVETTRLRSQFLALPQRNGDLFSIHFMRLFGSFFIVVGVVDLIWKPLNFPDPTLSETQQTSFALFLGLAFLGILLILGSISWYLSLRDRRSAGQKEPERKISLE